MKKRVITGVIGGAVFLTLVYTGGIGFGILLFFIALFGVYEWLRMNSIHIWSIQGFIGILFTLLFFIPSYVTNRNPMDLLMLELLLLLTVMVMSKNKTTIHEIAYILIGSVYIGYALHYMLITRMQENGLILTFAILAAIWTTDSGAYFVGRAMGKHKLWPTISPNKTIEGAIGGVILAILILSSFALLSGQLTVVFAILLALSVSISGQVGDLAESAVKRILDVKDSGKILPGHGGILDRFDSLLFVYPILHLFSLI